MGNAQVVALLLLRVVVGITMIAHGTNHWKGGGRIEGTARWFSGLGLRYGKLQAWMSVVTEIGAGALLVIGLLTPLACAAVISVMLIAGILAHRPNGFFVFKDGYEYVLVLSVVCLALATLGPGRVSVDAAAGITVTGSAAVASRWSGRGGDGGYARDVLAGHSPEGDVGAELGKGCCRGAVRQRPSARPVGPSPAARPVERVIMVPLSAVPSGWSRRGGSSGR